LGAPLPRASVAVVRFRPVLALLLTGSSASAGHLVAVRAVTGTESTVVQLDSDAPPSFTTMKLASPPRVVVDLADTSAAGVAPEQQIGDTVVRRIAVAEAGAHTTRVVIELAEDADFDVRASQTRVEVRIPRAVAVAMAEVPAPAGEAPQVATAAPLAAATEVQADAGESPGEEAKAKSIPEIAERAALPTVALVGAPAPGGANSGRPAASLPNSGRKAPAGQIRISGIGFRPLGGGEVLVRSDRPVEYEVSAADTSVLIHLRSAHIPLQNNRRPLDTRFFEGTIQRVVPLQVPGGTDIRIELRQRAEVHLEQSGPLLTVSFTPRG
jgi:AMIN domain-containing protein